jgi:hypothetical protein
VFETGSRFWEGNGMARIVDSVDIKKAKERCVALSGTSVFASGIDTWLDQPSVVVVWCS